MRFSDAARQEANRLPVAGVQIKTITVRIEEGDWYANSIEVEMQFDRPDDASFWFGVMTSKHQLNRGDDPQYEQIVRELARDVMRKIGAGPDGEGT